jgi:hypothetical protein
MNRRFSGIRAAAVAMAILMTTAVVAEPPTGAAGGAAESALKRPRDLRELVFLSSGYGMAYGPAAAAAKKAGGPSPFTNVFVTREGYRRFMQTGKWPDGTTFFLEVRQGVGHATADVNGAFQGTLIGLAAEQKDSARYPDGGFAFFDLGPDGTKESAQPLPHSAPCYACHSQHGAVEWTFTQFYPEQFAVAQHMGTVRKDYDPNRKLN